MKKTLTYISLSIGILLLSISAFIVPNVLAQDASYVTLNLEVDSGCTWSGTPYAPTSSLTVYDNEICYITGEGRQAKNVTVEHDVDSAGQAGGKLVIGGSSVTKTDFTVSDAFLADGIVEIGQTGDPTPESKLITNGVFKISNTGSNGILEIIANTNGQNFIDVNNNALTVGASTRTGIFRNNDNSTSTIYAIDLYGTFDNLNASGVITFDNASSVANYFNSGTFNNDGTVNSSSDIALVGTTAGDNSGTINVTLANLVIGNPFGTSSVTFNNSGDINVTGGGTLLDDGALIVVAESDFDNSGDIVVYDFLATIGAVFDNNSGGTITTNASEGVVWVDGTSADGYATLNNNSGGTITTYSTWLMADDASTGPGYTDSSTINNNSGGVFSTNNMTFTFEDGGMAQFGALKYGGIFNNAGTLTISGTGNAVSLYKGGKFNTLSGGLTDITAGNIKMGTLSTNDGDCESGGALMCTITNASTTGNAFRMNSTTAVINMYGYTKIDNTGGVMNLCNSTTCTTPSIIVTNANDTDIVNGALGELNIYGDLTLGYDAYLNSDGTIKIKGNSSSNNLVLNTSAVFHSKGLTEFNGTYQKVTLNNSAQLNIGSSGFFVTSTATGANSALTLNNSSSITNAGTVLFTGGALMAGTSTITNNDGGAAATFTIDDSSSSVNSLQIGSIAGDTPTFTNAAGATVTVDGDAVSGDGELRVYHGGSYANSGTTNTWYLFVGRHSTIDGGTLTNSGTAGMVNVYSNSTAVGTPALDIYRGQITNSSTYVSANGSFYVRGYFYMLGTGTGLNQATFTNTGVTYLTSNAYIYNYSLVQLNSAATSRFILLTGVSNVDGASGTQGQINVASGAVYSAVTTNLDNYATLINAGTINRINVSGVEQAASTSITANNSSTLTNQSTGYIRLYGGTVTLNTTSVFSNAGNINYTGGVGTKNGNINIYTSVASSNTATGRIYASAMTVSGTGANFTNNNIIDTTTFTVNTGGTVTNNSSLTASANFYAGTASSSNNILFTNSLTGTLNAGYLAVWGSNTTDIFTNYGSVTSVGTGTLYLGYQTSYTGGIINNYGTFVRGTGGSSIHYGATFNNFADATATFGGQTQVGYLSPVATYNQYAGTPGTTKSTFGALVVYEYGTVNNNDKIVTTDTLGIYPSAARLGQFYSNSGSTTQIGTSVTMQGIWTIASGATASVGTTIVTQQVSTSLIPTLTIDGTLSSAQSITVNTNSKLLSGNTSSITLTASPSVQMAGTTPFAELAGTVNAHSIHATGAALNNGYMCIGDYTGTYPTGSCDNVAASTVTLTGANANSIYVWTTSNTSTIEMANDVTMAGGIIVKKYVAGTTGVVNVLKDAIITINGRNADACLGVSYCAIDVGAYGADAGAATMNVYGDINLSTATNRLVAVGYNQATTGTGTLNVKSDATLGHGLIYDNTNTQLIVGRYVGEVNIERTDAANYGEMYMNNTCTINSNSAGTDGNRGANVNGRLRCYTNLTVASTGSMDVGRISTDSDRGVVKIDGSTTDIYGFTELDGLLDTGVDNGDTLTVYNLGTITSGVGTATNFEILAHDINVNSGGKIASDSVSEVDSGSQGAGSYGGAGESRASTASYGESKPDETDPPVYGQAGHTVAAVDTAARGGGGVRIYATGTITHNGEISADGNSTANADTGAGAGGTVIIVHEPLSTADAFTGSGTITANGGHSTDSSSKAGGGGRIMIKSPLLDDPDDDCAGSPAPHPHYQLTGTVSAYPGDGTTYAAAAGTIAYLGDVNNDDPAATVWGTLIVDQNNQTSLITTEISNLGDIDFARVEARNDAQVTYETNPSTPTSCFQVGTSTITGPTCNPNPDKPDVLYVGDSYTGAQQSACTGPEPSTINPVDYLYDQTPVFSAFYRNPEDSTAVRYVAIQVSDDDPTFTTGLIWDTTIDLGATNTVTPGQRTRDIEFDEDSTATGSIAPGSIYYVRMAFMDATNTYQGLWTHYDIGDHYNFEVLGNMTITDSCSGSMTILDDNPNGAGTNIRDVNGDTYGNAECALTVTSDSAAWSIFFGKAIGETAFEDATQTYNINEIDNAGADCTIQSDGAGTAEEEYGFNISSAASLINNNVRTDASCSQAYNSWNQSAGNYVFNVENSTSDNELVRVTSGGVTAGTAFTLNMHATVDDTTQPTDYSLDVRASISTNP